MVVINLILEKENLIENFDTVSISISENAFYKCLKKMTSRYDISIQTTLYFFHLNENVEYTTFNIIFAMWKVLFRNYIKDFDDYYLKHFVKKMIVTKTSI